jgi:O-antigen/teichoic acid export membrane protein
MKKNLAFLFSFLSTKGIVFLVPLLLADLLSDRDFGVLEYALAGIGMLINAIINLGVTGAYPYFIIREKNTEIQNGFHLHPIWLLLFFIVNQILYFGFNLYSLEFFMAINVSYIIANQQYISTKLKSHENIFKAIFLDAGLYILLLFFILGYYSKLVPLSISNISKGVFVYSVIFALYALIRIYCSEKTNIFKHYKKILIFSIHILISSSFLFFLAVCGRILTKHFFGYETTGVYGFYFRLAVIVVMIHQVISIRYFKDIYTLNPQKLDTYFSYFYIFIFSLSIVLYFIIPFIMPYFSDFFTETYSENKLVFLVLFCQMVMWIGSALNSNIVDREGLAKTNNWYFFGVFLISFFLFYILKNTLTLLSLTFIIYSIFFVTNLTQLLTLRTKKIIFKKSFFTLTFIYILSSTVLLIIT